MKKTLLFITMALVLLLTQCKKPEVKFPSPVAPEGTTVSMTITAGPGSKTDITPAGAITWNSGDKLYVGYNDAYVGYLTLTSSVGTPTGWFSGNVTLPNGTTGEETFHFFYLGSNPPAVTSGASSVEVSFATQEIYADDGKLKNASKHHVGYGSAKGTVAGSEVTGINVTLVSKVALACFSFTKDAAAYTDVLTLSGDNIYSSMTVGFNGEFNGKDKGTISLTGSHSERYVMLVPTGDATGQTLTFAGSSDEGEGKVPGLESNKFYGKTKPIAVTLTASAVHVTSVSLNKTSLSLAVGGTETLVPMVLPADATNKSVTWNSSAESVATVADGTVTAVAAGTATITVTTEDGGKTATCTVTVTAPAPTHETVNFGNPNLNWSVCNLGATNGATAESWYGDYYQWGGVTSVTSTTINVGWDGCPFTNGIYDFDNNEKVFTKYILTGKPRYWAGEGNPDNKLVLESSDDAATVALGSDWRMPTSAEWKSLYDNNTFEWLDAGANSANVPSFTAVAAGYLVVKGKESSLDAKVYMFLPAAGYRSGAGLDSAGSYGRYWSSSLISSSPNGAYSMDFGSGDVSPQGNDSRYFGYTVRPVR